MDASLTPASAYMGQLYAQQASQQKALAATPNSTKAQVYEKAKELEGTFLSVMIEPMFSKDGNSGVFGGGHGNDIYRSMMVQQYGQILSQSGGIGLADNIAKQMLALQEVKQ